MGNFIASKFNVFVLEKIYSQEITNSMILELDTISYTVCHFLSFKDLNSFFVFLFLEVSAELQSIILAHLLLIIDI